MKQWTSYFVNDPDDNYNVVFEILHDDGNMAVVRQSQHGLLLKWYLATNECTIPVDLFLELLLKAKEGLVYKEYIFQYVDIDSMQFINNEKDIRFEFCNRSSDGEEYCGTLTCTSVLSFNISSCDEDTNISFPKLVIEAYVKERIGGDNPSVTIMFEFGTHEICVICEEIQVVNNENTIKEDFAMNQWSASFANDSDNDYNIITKILCDDEVVAVVEQSTQGLILKWHNNSKELMMPVDWLLELLLETKRSISDNVI